MNLKNKSPKAEEIGRQQLGELMRACGISRVTGSDQLIGGRCAIKLTVETQEGYEPRNNVKGFRAITGSTAHAFTPAPAAQATASAAPTWARK